MGKQKNIFIIYFLCIFSFPCYSQLNRIDSLKQKINIASSDTQKARLYNVLAITYLRQHKGKETTFNAIEAYKIGDKIGDKKIKAQALLNWGNGEDEQSHSDTALVLFTTARDLFLQLKNLQGTGDTELAMGNTTEEKGYYGQALEHYILSLKAREKLADSAGVAGSLMGIGNTYFNMKRNDDAIIYYMKSYQMYKQAGNKMLVSWLSNNIGNAYYAKMDVNKALEFYNESIKIKKELKDEYGLSTSYNNLINIYTEQKKYSEALRYALLAYDLRAKSDNKHLLAESCNDLGSIYLLMKDYTKAITYFEKAVRLSEPAHALRLLVFSYNGLAQTHSGMNNFKEAYRYSQLLTQAMDSLYNIESRKQMNELSTRFETEKKDKELIKKDAEIRTQVAEGKQKSMQRNGFIAGFFGMICLAFFIFRGYRQKQKANIEISRQKGIIEIKNKETLDSIHYAKRIQKALFASDLLLRKNLDDYFVLHKPKDIVSGDFYWAFRTPDQFLLCVADCTGHGVPGAFMSLLNISFLNEITIEKRITRPDLVLDGLRTSIIHALNTEGNEQSQDGMDGIFCSFDFEKRIISYASANNNFYLIRNNTLIHGETDKMPVGKSPKDDQLFKLHTAEFQTGDLFYALTDGYADQFGGEKGKKFMYKRLEELLLTNAKLPLEKQKNILDTTLENWKGNLEQVDDICILGVRL